MPLPRRRPDITRRRALELRASCRDGCMEAIMLAHGVASVAVILGSVEVSRISGAA
jgi:hypothetical protein